MYVIGTDKIITYQIPYRCERDILGKLLGSHIGEDFIEFIYEAKEFSPPEKTPTKPRACGPCQELR